MNQLKLDSERSMQKLKYVTLILCLLPIYLVTTHAMAAPPNNLELLEEVQPPPNTIDNAAGNLPDREEGSLEPKITVRKKGSETIEEYRINGEMYMMKVTPAHGVPYYLHKEDSNGVWINDGPNPPLSVPKWILFRF